MKKTIISCLYLGSLFLVLTCLISCRERKKTGLTTSEEGSEYYSADDFNTVEKINTHVHFRIADSSFPGLAAKYNFRLLNISVNSPSAPTIETQQSIALKLLKNFPERVSFATTISVKNWGTPQWQKETIDHLQQAFDKGAIAVKVWKNIGMELKDPDGKFVMIDDPRFDPVLAFIEKNNKTLIAHLGEPRNCWLPVDQMTVKGDREYFTSHPQYHMYKHPEYPSYDDQVNARDHMLEKHPGLRFVGAHLGSLEWSVNELARRLDKYPNMAVDMAERISHLQYQAVNEWKNVHDFFIKYQDRLIYATDQRIDALQHPQERDSSALESWRRHWRFFTTGEDMKVPKVEKSFKGLKLPRAVVDKIYRQNAEKWFPQIAGSRPGS